MNDAQIVGSMELLGDPVGLVNKVSDSLLQFLKRTGVSLDLKIVYL